MLKRMNEISIIVGIRKTHFLHYTEFLDQVKIYIAYCLFGLGFFYKCCHCVVKPTVCMHGKHKLYNVVHNHSGQNKKH